MPWKSKPHCFSLGGPWGAGRPHPGRSAQEAGTTPGGEILLENGPDAGHSRCCGLPSFFLGKNQSSPVSFGFSFATSVSNEEGRSFIQSILRNASSTKMTFYNQITLGNVIYSVLFLHIHTGGKRQACLNALKEDLFNTL